MVVATEGRNLFAHVTDTLSCLHYLLDLLYRPTVSLHTSVRRLSRQHLRSSTQRFLVVPRCRLSTLGRPRAFSVAGPSLWNSLPDSLRDPDLGRDSFRHLLKMHLFTLYTEAFSVLEMFQDDALYKLTDRLRPNYFLLQDLFHLIPD